MNWPVRLSVGGYRSFKAERRVRVPHGVLAGEILASGMWESLAIRLPWEQEIAGSNPAALIVVRRRMNSRVGGCKRNRIVDRTNSHNCHLGIEGSPE